MVGLSVRFFRAQQELSMANLAGWLKFQELSTNKYSSDVVLTTFAIQVDQDKNPKPVEKLILRISKS